LTLAGEDRQISPTRFHNSVHNAAAGYWGIAYQCTQASTSLCANDASFGAGLLEAAAQLSSGAQSVLLLAYDADYPPPLRGSRPIPDAFGTALLLTAAHVPDALGCLRIELTHQPSTTMSIAGLEAVRRSTPAARGLPLMECIARRRSTSIVLDYLDDLQLAIEVRA
jgi:hypothetical protein